ncbi:MAG: hypothetical protein KAJ51_12850 [Thermoplasmata archaeon]|nr:hypothetical protein [Thermoplasmata archaeon]
MKKKLLIIILIFTIINIAFSGCIYDNENSNYECEFSYSIDIIFSNNTDFTLLIPLPLFSNGTISNIITSKLEIENGNANWSINNSIKGKAIKIEGIGNVNFYSSGNSDLYAYDHLSLQNNNKREYWIYLDSGDNSTREIEINADCHCDKDSETTLTRISGEINNGWNVVNGVHSHSID